MRCLKSFTDRSNQSRKNGEEWLIKMSDTETYIPDVYEEVVGVVNITSLSNRQYCVILNPVDENGKPQLSKKKLVRVCFKFKLHSCRIYNIKYCKKPIRWFGLELIWLKEVGINYKNSYLF